MASERGEGALAGTTACETCPFHDAVEAASLYLGAYRDGLVRESNALFESAQRAAETAHEVSPVSGSFASEGKHILDGTLEHIRQNDALVGAIDDGFATIAANECDPTYIDGQPCKKTIGIVAVLRLIGALDE